MPTVAVIGASSDPAKFGNRAVRAGSDALLDEARRLGLQPICACAIRDIGERP